MSSSNDLSRPWRRSLFTALALLGVLMIAGCKGSSDGVFSGAYASLSWVAPSQRIDGKRLSMAELDGYTIRYGQSPQRLAQTVEIDDPNTMEHDIQGLSSGTWYFAIQSRDQSGNLSPLSAPVSKSIP